MLRVRHDVVDELSRAADHEVGDSVKDTRPTGINLKVIRSALPALIRALEPSMQLESGKEVFQPPQPWPLKASRFDSQFVLPSSEESKSPSL